VKGEDLPLHLTIIAGTYLIFLPLVVGWRALRSLLKVAKESHDQAERLRTQQQSHEIKLEILDVQAYPKLGAGKSKRIEGNLIVSWEVFFHTRITSRIVSPISIKDFSASVNEASGKIIKSESPIQDLTDWSEDVKKEIHHNVGSTIERIQRPLNSIFDGTLDLTQDISKTGWIRFMFEPVPLEAMRDGLLTITAIDSTGKKHYGMYSSPRALEENRIWPKGF
jgi:hypothetical protein